jgi:hypothetical protein
MKMIFPLAFSTSLRNGLTLVLLSVSAGTAFGQTSQPLTPLLANLTVPLDSSRAKVGTHVQARAIEPWSHGGCTLAFTALVEGHVSAVERRTRTDKKSALHIVFDNAECGGKRGTPLNVIVLALLGPYSMGRDVTDVPVGAPIGLRSVEAETAVNRDAPQGRSLPRQWTAGMVVDLPKMNLSVGTGAEGGSIVWAMNTDARIEGQTTLIMMAKD